MKTKDSLLEDVLMKKEGLDVERLVSFVERYSLFYIILVISLMLFRFPYKMLC